MVPDAECIKIITEILDKLEFNSHVIKMNHRKILDAIYEICGVPHEKFREVTSSIDKLDKLGWKDVKKFLLESISEEIFEKIYNFISYKGDFRNVLNFLKSNESIGTNKLANEAIADLELLYKYCEILKISDRVSLVKH
jgi:histidyl-tRNA synthetase